MQTILGANGTIGSVLARELVQYTNRIRLVSRRPVKVNRGDEVLAADLTDPAQVDRAVQGSDVVYLLVGFEYKLKVWKQQWPELMRAVIAACKKHGAKLVFFDNVYLYSELSMGFMTEQSAVDPPSEKGKVRRAVADMLMQEMRSGELTALIARSADFYGPFNEKSFLIETVYKNLKKGKKANWFINASHKHSFTYTPDAARATALLGNTPAAYGQVWHLPTDPDPLTGKQYVKQFAREMNTGDGCTVLPMWMLKCLGIFIPFLREMPEMMYQYDRPYIFNSAKFMKQFPDFKITGYKEGIRETVAIMANERTS